MTQAERNRALRKLRSALKRGDSISTACKAAGISRTSFYAWRNQSVDSAPSIRVSKLGKHHVA